MNDRKTLQEKLVSKKIKLVSRSPRRKELLSILGIKFYQVDFSSDEQLPNIALSELAGELARKKALDYQAGHPLQNDEIIITADTIVVVENKILGKPNDIEEAKQFLRLLSGKSHQVITGVTLMDIHKTLVFQEVTDIVFKELTEAEIDYYVTHYKPLDKAGAYGIQEWIGAVAVEKIEGSYYNVMGLPVHRIYKEMMQF